MSMDKIKKNEDFFRFSINQSIKSIRKKISIEWIVIERKKSKRGGQIKQEKKNDTHSQGFFYTKKLNNFYRSLNRVNLN